MIRCFVAIELNEAVRTALAELQRRLRAALEKTTGREAKLQWVRPESIHATIKFLGDVDEGRVEAITQALRQAATRHQAGEVQVGGLGVFPDARKPRVCWIGLREGAEQVIRLAEAVDLALAPLEFPRESRPYRPHLTLARIKEGERAVGLALEQQGLLAKEQGPVGRLPVHSLALMKSELRPSGAVYTRLEQITLKDER